MGLFLCKLVMKPLCDLGPVMPVSGPSFQLLYNDFQTFDSLEFWLEGWPPQLVVMKSSVLTTDSLMELLFSSMPLCYSNTLSQLPPENATIHSFCPFLRLEEDTLALKLILRR